MMTYKFTEADACELNIPLHLLHAWEHTMNTLWLFLKKVYEKERHCCKVANGENSILYTSSATGFVFEISLCLINKKYLELKIRRLDNEDFEIGFTHFDKLSTTLTIRTVVQLLIAADSI